MRDCGPSGPGKGPCFAGWGVVADGEAGGGQPVEGHRGDRGRHPARARSRGIAYQLGREPKTASRMSLIASSSSSIARQTSLDAR